MLALWAALAAPPVALRVDADRPEGCPGRVDLLARIKSQLPDASIDPYATHVLRVRFGRQARGLSARLSSVRPGQTPSERNLSSASTDCDALAGAVALTVVLILDPMYVPPEPPPKPPRKPRPKPAPRPSALWFGVHGGVAFGAGHVAGVGLNNELGLQVGAESWRVGLSGRWLLGAREGIDGGAVSGELRAGALTGCWVIDPVTLCGLGVLGVQVAEGAEFAVNRSVDAPYVAVGARAEHGWRFGDRWRVAVRGELAVPLNELRLTLDDEVVWRTAGLAGDVGIDLALRFW